MIFWKIKRNVEYKESTLNKIEHLQKNRKQKTRLKELLHRNIKRYKFKHKKLLIQIINNWKQR